MASFNFKPQFVDPIEAGTKGGTIRAYRRFTQKVNSPMYLFCGLRQVKPARRIVPPGLGFPPQCRLVWSIIITKRHNVWVHKSAARVPEWAAREPKSWGFRKLTGDEKDALALFDGFESFEHMMTFWDGRLPFLGHWNCWLTPPIMVNRAANQE